MKKNIFYYWRWYCFGWRDAGAIQFENFTAEINLGNEEDIEALINEVKKVDADIVILDLILPKLDGFEIIKAIRSDDEISDIYIFIFTDVSDEDSKSARLERRRQPIISSRKILVRKSLRKKWKRLWITAKQMDKSEGNTYQF